MIMETTKTLKTLLAVILVTSIGVSGVSAYQNGTWEWGWTGNNSWTNSNFVDTNWNWIADWKEDWDNDGILNKDDSDYEKTYTNIKDDDNDGVPNNEDEDYEREPALYWEGNNDNARSWNANQVKTFTEKRAELKNKLSSKYSWAADWLMNAFNNKYKNTPDDQARVKYEELLWKLDWALVKIQNMNITNAKKESYLNLFEYIKVQTQERLEELQEEEEDDELDDFDLDALFN